ncbi:CEI_1a_G0050670.mRNA.1.CDS.1 [Saccharomyces cerevisiae]|nr:EM14S01-3B_G0028930.mRNA.1.CDS.1 [Saccharomyces cerevisiae]CAI4792657.1 CEI_1a_G0050670.mRNA.1.CDS.1 [Saccharomyces cerevisiae]CAI4798941.1 AMH_1a_G0050770.mRNA.1.CDS.1 [Saccharomyces cerevisiae]CAI6886225.1 AMH_1a_G0050770.mRNA.1.CDS.1 [Saccharomyces cerevisiae]CAI7464779.1 CEI_1a_G0050670.mRNA.1.CDS.1 [Saccharomyces cerevisiae]
MSAEPLLPTHNGSQGGEVRSPDQKFIVIRFSDVSVRDLQLNISNVPFSNINTHWLRRMCRELRPQQTQKRRLKFIRNGSILNTHSKIAEELTHYFDTANNSNVATGTSVTPEQNNYYIHCIIGTEELTQAELANEDLKDDATPSNDSMTTQAIGFDRLRSVGFTEQEIELLRQQFRATYGDLEEEEERLAQNGNRDDEGHDIRQLEEQWMESGSGTAQGNGAGGGNEDRFNSVPIANIKHNKDLLLGICVGFFFGVFGILLMKFDGLFNRRQKMAIFAGVIVNVMFCLVRGF